MGTSAGNAKGANGMYRVWIADDEPLVILSLKHSIDWGALGLEVAGESRDGLDAYEKVTRFRPDILITDVRMPGLDGLTLIEQLRMEIPRLEIILISGYAEFEYARTAIKNGVGAYCLKPIDEEELKSALESAVYRLDTERAASNAWLMDMICPSEPLTEDMLRSILHPLELSPEGLTILVSVGRGPASLPRGTRYAVLKTGALRHVYFANFERAPDDEALAGFAGQSYGLSIVEDVKAETVADAVQDALLMAYLFFVRPQQRVFRALPDDALALEALARLRQVGGRARLEAREILRGYLERGDAFARSFHIGHAMTLYNLLSDGEESIYDFDAFLLRFPGIDGLFQYLLKPEQDSQCLPAVGSETLGEVLGFIEANYIKPLSLRDVSDALHINANYIGMLFREKLDTTFTQYVTARKMHRACQLLRETRLSIEEIARAVGYSDYFYFLRVFKKIEKISPGAYRAKQHETQKTVGDPA